MFSFYRQGQDAFIPVRLLTAAGQPASGLVAGTVTVTIVKPDGLAPLANVPTFGWTEYTFGALAGQGIYGLTIPAANINQAGEYIVAVSSSSGAGSIAEIDVQAADSTDVMNRLGVPTGATFSADIATATTSLTQMSVSIARLLGLQKENSVLDQEQFDAGGRLTQARLRCYDSAANATAAGTIGLLFSYQHSATYDANGKLVSFTTLRVL